MPLVSVLLPCYNAAATLPEALASLRWQSLQDFEIIAVDDGSTDETRLLLEGWSAQDARLRLVCQRHAGIVAALQHGLAHCRAPYIARMDADDRCHPQRLARQLAYLEQHPELAVVGCLVRAFSTTAVSNRGMQIYIEWLNALTSDAAMRREIFVESPLAHPSVLLRREWLEQVGGYQEHGWPEDYDLWLRLYLAGARFGKVPELLLEWRDHPERLTRSDGRYSLQNFLRAKAHYLLRGPLAGREALIIWGAGITGRRLSKQLLANGAPLVAFVDVDQQKIGRQRAGRPILAPAELPGCWARYSRPVLLAAVGARGARSLIRQQLEAMGLREGQDWWGVA